MAVFIRLLCVCVCVCVCVCASNSAKGHGFSQMHWMRMCSNATREAEAAFAGEVDGPLETGERAHVDFPLNGLPSSVDPLTNVVTISQLKEHRGGDGSTGDVWMAIRGKVYNVSSYFKYHPGGEAQLRRGAGIDATKLFGTRSLSSAITEDF